jgi:hypothetical protein
MVRSAADGAPGYLDANLVAPRGSCTIKMTTPGVCTLGLRKTTSLFWLCWLCFGIAYYGTVDLITVIYSRKRADPSEEVTAADDAVSSRCSFDFAYLALCPTAELFFVFVGQKIIEHSRRAALSAFFTAGALALLAMQLATGAGSNGAARGVSAYTARGALFAAGGVAWTFTPEVYPTDVRVSGTGLAYALGRVGAFGSDHRGRNKGATCPTSKGASLGRVPLVSADFWTSDHPPERSRSVGDFLERADYPR